MIFLFLLFFFVFLYFFSALTLTYGPKVTLAMLVMTVYVMTSQVTMQGQLHMLLSFFFLFSGWVMG